MNDWISVDDRLPPWYEWVYIWSVHAKMPLRTRRVETGYKDDDGESKWSWDWSHYAGLIDHGVTVWMPLPAPPTGESE